ncbi:unnamed protein product [Amaranthus hypochondriacus]
MADEEVADEVDQVIHQWNLPIDLISQHIMRRLPIKSLIKFKSVSKQWYATISSHHFALTHFKFSPYSFPSSIVQFLFIQNRNNYYLFTCNDEVGDDIGNTIDTSNPNLVKISFNFHDDIDNELVLIGSCNGLVCLASFSDSVFILWNPLTGQFRKYSDPDFSVNSTGVFRISWGFGYVSLTDDYKIVRVLELSDGLLIKVHVFSLKLNKWTRIDNELYHDILSSRKCVELENDGNHFRRSYVFHSRRGILVNETLYWSVYDSSTWGRGIIAFDLARETFDTIVDLELVSNNVYWDKFLCVMGGCLSKCGVNMRDDVYIDMLKGLGKVDYIRLFRDLRLRSCQSVVGFTRTGKFFILLEDSTIVLVDPGSQPMKVIPVVTFNSLGKSRISTFVPSLISPYNAA